MATDDQLATLEERETLAVERVEWTIAAFMAYPQASHAELVAILDSIELPFPTHACAMVPLAFGRQLLEGIVKLSSTYQQADREVAFADDLLYVAARARARSASKQEIETIGLRSAEVNAVNQALNAGSKPEDLVLATAMVPADPAGAPRRFGGAERAIADMVRAHGADLVFDARVVPKRVQSGQAMLQLDVRAHHDGRDIIESYAGFAATIIEAQKQALQKFAESSLHVLIAVLAGRDRCRDHVDWEPWREFEMCFGGVLRQFSQDPPVELRSFLGAVRDSLPPLSSEVHWCSIFVAIDHGRMTTHQITLDNAPHAAGVEVAQGWVWPHHDAFYTLRHFFMLVPAEPAA